MERRSANSRSKRLNLVMAALVVGFTGCAYRLPPLSPPAQERIRILAAAPEQYRVRIDTGTPTETDVPADGRIQANVPGYRRSCGVYLFNKIKVGGYDDPLNAWSITVIRSGKAKRQLSMRSVMQLPVDSNGDHMLKIEE